MYISIVLLSAGVMWLLSHPHISKRETSGFGTGGPRVEIQCRCIGLTRVHDQRPVDGDLTIYCYGIVSACTDNTIPRNQYPD